MDLPYAEDINYWKTGRSDPNVWIDKTIRIIEQLGGEVQNEAFGSDRSSGRSAFMIQFSMNSERFKVVWPVLPSKRDEDKAARIQAATLLYHDCKAKAISAAVWGVRAAFFQFLMLPDGRTASEIADQDLLEVMPETIRPQLEDLH